MGRAPTIVGGSVTGNWILQNSKPSSGQLNNYLSGHGGTGAAGLGGGANVLYSPGNGFAGGWGIMSPQIGGNYSYTFKGPGNLGISW